MSSLSHESTLEFATPPSLPQESIISRLRPRTHKAIVHVSTSPKTPKKRLDARRRRRQRASSSSSSQIPSPYIGIQSSPYVFDDDFYNNN